MDLLPDDHIDLTVTSPPYDNMRTYNGFEWDFEQTAKELYRVTKPGGVVVWVVGDATVKGSETGTSFRQALFFKDCGFNLHDTMIYEKVGAGAVGSNLCYWQNFEYMFVFSKGRPKTFNPICDRKNVRAMREKAGPPRGKQGTVAGKISRYVEASDFGRRFNNWKITPQTQKGHPAPFPESLAHDHIVSWSSQDDLVFDPFSGSGTTAVAALKLNRRFIGCDISKEYVDLAKRRIADQK